MAIIELPWWRKRRRIRTVWHWFPGFDTAGSTTYGWNHGLENFESYKTIPLKWLIAEPELKIEFYENTENARSCWILWHHTDRWRDYRDQLQWWFWKTNIFRGIWDVQIKHAIPMFKSNFPATQSLLKCHAECMEAIFGQGIFRQRWSER